MSTNSLDVLNQEMARCHERLRNINRDTNDYALFLKRIDKLQEMVLDSQITQCTQWDAQNNELARLHRALRETPVGQSETRKQLLEMIEQMQISIKNSAYKNPPRIGGL